MHVSGDELVATRAAKADVLVALNDPPRFGAVLRRFVLVCEADTKPWRVYVRPALASHFSSCS
jgi:hypothetical protein